MYSFGLNISHPFHPLMLNGNIWQCQMLDFLTLHLSLHAVYIF